MFKVFYPYEYVDSVFSINYDELYNNYQGFCYLIYKVLENGKK